MSSPSRSRMAAAVTVMVDRPLRVIRVEAEEAQHAQEILADALTRVADEPYAAGGEVGEAADRIGDAAVTARGRAR